MSGARFSKVPKTFRAVKTFPKLRPAYSVNLVFSFVAKGIKIKTIAKFRAFESYVTRNAPEKVRDFRKTGPWPELLKTWLVLASVNYHGNV